MWDYLGKEGPQKAGKILSWVVDETLVNVWDSTVLAAI